MENCPLEVFGFLSLSHLRRSMLSEHQTSPSTCYGWTGRLCPTFSLCSLAELTSVWNKPFLYQEVMAKTLCPIVHQLIHWQRFVKGKPSIRNLSAHPRWCYACFSLCFPFEAQIFISKVFRSPNVPHCIPALTAAAGHLEVCCFTCMYSERLYTRAVTKWMWCAYGHHCGGHRANYQPLWRI